KELPPDELRSRIDPIIETIPEAVPRDRLYILKKMPSDLWNLEHVQAAIAEKSSNLDFHSLSYFLNQLNGAKSINPESLRYLSQSEEHTSELQSRENLVCRLLLEKKKKKK